MIGPVGAKLRLIAIEPNHDADRTGSDPRRRRAARCRGWARETIVVVDDDLGRSGATIEGRLGFQRLVAEVGLGRVGLVLGIEMSRLMPLASGGKAAALGNVWEFLRENRFGAQFSIGLSSGEYAGRVTSVTLEGTTTPVR
jgi:hypothetical protein